MIVKPKKHLGQHFLTDRNIAAKIVQQLSGNHSHLLEIGPGTGILTELLLDLYPNDLHLIEVDSESVVYLETKFPSLKNNLLQADFLKVNEQDVFVPNMAIIGNFPYNISSQIFFRVLDHRNEVNEVVCMIQKEVAERLASPPGNKTYGILSVLLQAWYDIEYCFTVNEHVFYPPPKVKSAVIRLKRNERSVLDCDEKLFQIVVKKGFNQRRKTLRNALKELLHPTISPHEVFNKRAEQLHLSDFVMITKLISESRLTINNQSFSG
ncbi:MAG: 16S rRNA (adenine(1518)-N(6)/adenine(1519)-N(6))-dimethyltransferase RsmA [Bacteroidales bacterium]|nr:16S rRNA (adenine(1518)-N(6)/adenine(1519)-N(6))-dimethyltransferase RsmA [Bacteroidales bacterium]